MTSNHTKPVISLKIFAGNIIDYAGLFPPANLGLGQAFHNYLFYRQGEMKWMLNKFIIPAGRLEELTDIMKDMKIEGQVLFSVLGSGSDSVENFKESLEKDIKNISDFIENHGPLVSVDAFEIKLPNEIIKPGSGDELIKLMNEVSDTLEKALRKNIPVYFEASLKEEHEVVILRVVESIAGLGNGCGFKLRTGGTEASAFPTAEQIAFAIMTCCEFEVPMKCTAGLHHPIRHYNSEVSSNMHGFLNVFGAGILAYTDGFDESELLEVLDEEDPYEFIFGEAGFEWNGTAVPISEIKEAREKFMISYGSCSFDEPIEDLKTLELL
jgi:hypothetical protein